MTAQVQMFRFQVKVGRVFDYLFDPYSTYLDTSRNMISVWVREENLEAMKANYSGLPIRVIPSQEYWDNYDGYQDNDW